MDDNAAKETPPPDFNKIDLSQLQGFSFGTQWTQDKSGAGQRDRGDAGPRRDERRDLGGEGADRRDRRAFRRADGPPSGGPENRAPAGPGGPAAPGAPARREYAGDRRPRPDSRDPRDFRGGGGRMGSHENRPPYDSPYFSVTFYPEDTSFNALVKTVRASCRTIELFEIARTVLGKAERFTVLLTRKDPSAPNRPSVPARMPVAPAPADPAADGKEDGATADSSVPKEPIFISVPDSLPFENEELALAHVLGRHLKVFFDLSEAEVEPPKGNFQVINRCGVTGELLGPPNYHRYTQIVQQHYAAQAIRIPFEAYRSRIESVREPEVVAQWLEKMKKVTRYTWKLPVAEGTPAPVFDNFEDTRAYLLASARDKLVRPSGHARFHGREVETLPIGEIRRAVEGTLERQRRFPLDTANALRGRLRREHFTIFKKGAKGISYVCAVKRKFRTPGQTFADSIGSLITFVEAHPMVKAGELPKRFLGLAPDESLGPDAAAAALANVLSVAEREKIARLQGDLLWLVREGYVTEFIDGALYAPPPMVEARKKEVEREEHDPENFPDRPPEAEGAAPAEPAAGAAAPEAVPPEATVGEPAAAEPVSAEPSPAEPAAAEIPAEAPAAGPTPAPPPAESGPAAVPS
jgi:hypothetical protein